MHRSSMNVAVKPKEGRLRVLLSAYACEPDRGSEPGVGWHMALGLAADHDVWVLTRSNNRPGIEAWLDKHPVEGLHFIYHDLPPWARFWKRGAHGVRTYYYLWQWTARALIRRVHAEIGFDLAHHVTFVKYWLPTCLTALDIPFVWGPVGGGEDAPLEFWPSLGAFGVVYECARMAARRLAERDPSLRDAVRRAARILATAGKTRARLEVLAERPVEMLSEVAFPRNGEALRLLLAAPPAPAHPFRCISIGELLPLKAFHLGLMAFAEAALPEAEYWIVGDGQQRGRLEGLAEKLGIHRQVRFWGRLAYRETLQQLTECNALVHPSLHESGGWVCLEAMAAARPVVCFDIGGPAAQVTADVGIRCATTFRDVAVFEMANAIRRLAMDPLGRAEMGQAGRRHILENYLLENRVRRYSRLYRELVSCRTTLVSQA